MTTARGHLLAADVELAFLSNAVDLDTGTLVEYRQRAVAAADHLNEAIAEHRRTVEELNQ